jgi:hypothetical protein
LFVPPDAILSNTSGERHASVQSVPGSRTAALMPDSTRPLRLGLVSVFDFGAGCAAFSPVSLIHSAMCSDFSISANIDSGWEPS